MISNDKPPARYCAMQGACLASRSIQDLFQAQNQISEPFTGALTDAYRTLV